MHFNIVSGRAFFWPLARFLRELPRDYVGTLFKVQANHGDLVHWRKFGGLLNFAFICDHAANRELFVRNTDALGKSALQIQTFLYAAGLTVATAHGGDWRTKRKEANLMFSRSAVAASCGGQIAVSSEFIASLGTVPQDAILVSPRLDAQTVAKRSGAPKE